MPFVGKMDMSMPPSTHTQPARTINIRPASDTVPKEAPRSSASQHVTTIKHVAAVKMAPSAKKAPEPTPRMERLVSASVLQPAANLSSQDIDQFFADLDVHDVPGRPLMPLAPSDYGYYPEEDDDDDTAAAVAPTSYASAARQGVELVEEIEVAPIESSDGELLCPFFYNGGECPHGEACTYLHGEQCAICLMFCITEHNGELHEAECLQGVEENAHFDDLLAHSATVECGICYETVLENKNPTERRYV